jgi:hypothetical protein
MRSASKTPVTRLTQLWIALIGLTLLSTDILGRPGYVGGRAVSVVAVLAVTLTKARIIGLDYMELRRAPLWLRLVFEVWLLLVCSGIGFLYLAQLG